MDENNQNPIDEIEKKAIKRAKSYTSSATLATVAIAAIGNPRMIGHREPDYLVLQKEIKEQTEKVQKGDTSGIETTLMCQAKALDMLFNTMVTQAVGSEHLDAMRAHMDIALRAQNQGRKTLLALAAIKYPPQQQFVGQQNIALNQQVNNGVSRQMVESQGGGEHLGNIKIKPKNELLEKQDGKRLDTKAPSATIKAHSPVEAVEVGGGKNTRRKRAKQNERS